MRSIRRQSPLGCAFNSEGLRVSVAHAILEEQVQVGPEDDVRWSSLESSAAGSFFTPAIPMPHQLGLAARVLRNRDSTASALPCTTSLAAHSSVRSSSPLMVLNAS